MPEGAEVVDEESVEEDVVKVVKEAGAEVVDEESVEEDVVKVVKEAGAEVVDEESVEEDVVKVVKEAGVDLGVTAKYATAPARTIITITISAVTVRDMARDELPLKLLTRKIYDNTRCSIICMLLMSWLLPF